MKCHISVLWPQKRLNKILYKNMSELNSKSNNETVDTSFVEEVTISDTESSNKKIFELSESVKEKLKDVPEALEYIEKLQNIIKKQIKKIEKWKTRIKKLRKPKDAFTQTDAKHIFIANDDSSAENKTEQNEKSLADDIKEAAEMAIQNSGFVYEETSGMYYDYNTGYYYNAEYGLYYDGSTGMYLKYNQETQSYEYHSQVTTTQPQKHKEEYKYVVKKRKSRKGQKTKDSKRHRGKDNSRLPIKDMEEGECSESENSSNESSKSDESDISRQWPPCMRLIVESSDVQKVKIGSLHIITCDGGTLGREGDHSILIPDINASKHHLKFTFDKDSGHYVITDLGSRNGTLLNGKRMSPSKQESEVMKITHGSKIQIGSTILLCHIHEGTQTCGHCEPGLLQSPQVTESTKINKTSRAQKHKNELKNLRKMCGIMNYDEDPKLATGYTDRAQKRRETVGSQNPHEKTKMASLDESISSENKGFKLLAKMGWKEGQSLGKEGEGLLEPIKLVSNKGTTGIGCNDEVPEPAGSSEKQNIWKKTQERFQKLPDSNNAFEEDSED